MIFRFLFFWAMMVSCFIHVNAQYTIQGTVVESDTGVAVEFATVQLLTGSANTFVGYSITDINGSFSIKGNRTDSLKIVVSSIGFDKYEQSVSPGDVLTIKLEADPFVLEEVVVRAGRVWNRSDTIIYDVDRFRTLQDRTLKDVLQKLPGIDVNDQGRISYLGKDISNFYIEGMDPVGGRYNQITNNLRAETVQAVQVMENHQPIKMLEDIVASEDIAINLRLKAEFQAVWMFTLEGGIGINPILWYTSDNAIRLSRTNQSITTYKGNNTGNDVTFEQSVLGARRNSLFEVPPALSYLSMPSIMAPLKKERLLFNDVHSFSSNRMSLINETTKMRISANYTHDERQQERGSETIYYQLEDTVQISELSHTKLYSDDASFNVQIENNAADKLLTNNFSAYGKWNKGVSDFSGNLAGNPTTNQQLLTSTLGASNDFRTLWGKENNRFEIRSFLRYDHQPEEVKTDFIKQNTLLNRLYTDNSFSITHQTEYFIPQVNVGFTGDWNNLHNGFTPYVSPNFQWNKDKWQTSFALPVLWTHYSGVDFSRLSVRPSANLAYKPNYAWRFTLSARYREQYGDILNFTQDPYYSDYRNIVLLPEQLPVQKVQNYMLYGEYKKTASEFFTSLSLSYMQSQNSHIYEQTASGGYVSAIPWELSNNSTSWRTAATISKGFYDIRLNTSLSAQFSQNKGEQFSQGERLPFLSNRFNLEPKLNWTYWANFIFDYQANFNLTSSTIGNRDLNPLWSIIQKLQLSYVLSSFETILTTEHYYNEVNNSTPVNNYFVDLSFRLKLEKWRFMLNMNNLLDKRQYGYTEYSEIRSYSSWINIRGREFLLGVQYRF